MEKGDRGGFLAFACRQPPQIPVGPRFPKGEMARSERTRISNMNFNKLLAPQTVVGGLGRFVK